MRLKMREGENKPPVQVEGLRKSFGDQKVLNGIHLSVARGESVAVLGQSGTGKSVLLKLLIGLQRPDAGAVRIHGQDIGQIDARQLSEIRKRMGFLFQQAALYDSLTVEENVEFPLTRHTAMPPAERHDRVRELLSTVGMESDVKKFPSQISGGMLKRVGMARALALNPDLLLLDEPTSGLDPITAAEIATLVRGLQQSRDVTSVVVTHDILHAGDFADRLIVLREGNIVLEGTLEELQRSRDPFVGRFLGAAG
jgi:phospholipid/cholesterol/gamma-HCH transport system ATP-binding protein